LVCELLVVRQRENRSGALVVSVIGAKRLIDFVWPTLAFFGILLLTPLRSTSTLAPFGILCVFGYSVLWALYIVTSSRCSRTTPGLTGLCLAMVVAAGLTAPFADLSTIGSLIAKP